MKTKVTLWFDSSKIPGNAETILIPAGCGPEVAHVAGGYFLYDTITKEMYPGQSVTVELDEGDPRIAKLHELLALYGEKATTENHVEHSEDDLQNARLLLMSPGSKRLQSRTSELGTKYDLKQACTHCGTGMKQVWFERVKRKEWPLIQKHRAIMTLDSHIIVDAVMHKMLVDAGITGISFAEVQMRDEIGDWNPIDREQILIESTLPPMRMELDDFDKKFMCPVCQRGGRLSRPKTPYHQEDLVGMCDFNLTWEWFGFFTFNGKVRDSQLSAPSVLVTPKVRNIFHEAGEEKTFKWKPIGIAQ